MTQTGCHLRPIRAIVVAAAMALSLAACADSPESLLAKANESIAKKDTKAAEIHLKNLLQKEDRPEARYLLGTVYMKAGDLLGAEKEFQRAVEGGGDKARIAPEYADLLLQLGKSKKLLEDFAEVSPEQPEAKAHLLTAIGRAHLAQGKQEEAKSSFDAALAAQADYAPAQIALLVIQASKGDLAGAGAGADRVLTQQPNSPHALAFKGDLELAQGRAKEAREFFVKAAAADPQDRNTRAKIAAIALDLKELEAAQSAVDELKKLTGPAPGTMQLQAQIHLRQNKVELARDAILVALKVAPDYLPALALSAQIHLALNSLELAEQHARRVLDAAPRSTLGYRLLASVFVRKNEHDRALGLLQPMLDKGTKDGALYALAGEAALRANEPVKATAYFEQASKLAPKNSRIVTGLALASLAKGDRERGILELEQASGMDETSAQADYALVMTHLRAREYDKALAAVERLEKKQPDSALAANLRGAALAAKGDLAGARKALELAQKRDPKFLPAAANLAALDLREKKVDQAKKRYITLLENDPKNVLAMLALAQIEQGTHNIELAEQARADALAGKLPDREALGAQRGDKEAFEWLKKAHETDRASVPAAVALASWYIGNRQAKDAIPLLQELLAGNPENIQLLDALGTAYLRSDQPVQAMESFEKILRLKPDSAPLQFRLGQLKLSRGDTVGAMQNFRKAAEIAPKALEPRAAIAAVHLRSGKPEEARKIAVALQKEQPKNPAGLLLEGDIAIAERKYGDAASAYRKAVALQKAIPAQLKLHHALRASGSSKDADSLLERMIKEEPGSVQLRMYAGEAEIALKRWASAIEHYEIVIAKQPNNALALNNSAWARYESKDPKALEYAERAAQAAPQSAAVLDTLGVILSDRGDTDRGIKALRQAVSYAPRAPQTRLHLAEALIKAGDKAAARAEIEMVLRDFKGEPIAEKAKELRGKL